MPFVNIKITNEGVTPEWKAELIQGVTKLLQVTLGGNSGTIYAVDLQKEGIDLLAKQNVSNIRAIHSDVSKNIPVHDKSIDKHLNKYFVTMPLHGRGLPLH